MSELARILAYYPDFALPEMGAALYIHPQWFESFMRNCADDDIAITGMCWFEGTRDELKRTGSFDEWKSVPAATWGEYKLAANEVARHQLGRLPPNGAVLFEYATPKTWWRSQQEGRKWDAKLDRSHQVAHYDGHQVVLESRIARPGPMPGSGVTSWSWLRLLITLPLMISLLVQALHSCSGNGN
jgi:hypothetical protein